MKLTKELAVTSIEKIVTIVCDGFVWGFGIFLLLRVGNSIREFLVYYIVQAEQERTGGF